LRGQEPHEPLLAKPPEAIDLKNLAAKVVLPLTVGKQTRMNKRRFWIGRKKKGAIECRFIASGKLS
jgi:hypothetical protein